MSYGLAVSAFNRAGHAARLARKAATYLGIFGCLALTGSLFATSGAARAADGDATAPRVVVAFGDSLTAGYNLPPGTGFPEQLERYLQSRGLNVDVRNAGWSGGTSFDGRAQLEPAVAAAGGSPDLVIVEFGANDALRGLEPALTRANLEAMLTTLRDRAIPVLLAGMLAPPNLGEDYGREFNAIYPDLAAQFDVALYPFFLDGVAAVPELNLADGIHPNEAGVGVIVERIGPLVERLLAGDPVIN